MQVRIMRARDISSKDRDAWSALEQHALEPNAYLSPSFVLPALLRLRDAADANIFFVEKPHSSGFDLLAVGVFVPKAASRYVPVPHYEAYLGKYSYLSGLLVSSICSEAAVGTLLRFLRRDVHQAVVFPLLYIDGLVAELIDQFDGAKRSRIRYQRARMTPATMGEEYLCGKLSTRNKRMLSSYNKLRSEGEVRYLVYEGTAVTDEVIERHLTLEHMGWKGAAGTSMLSYPSDAQFFREMTKEFASQNTAIFCELRVGEKPIAMSSNFLSGRNGYAFKIGFDPCYAKYSPGIMCELELIKKAKEWGETIDYFDSGSVPGSYIEELWLERYTIADRVIALSPLANIAISASHHLQMIKRSLI